MKICKQQARVYKLFIYSCILMLPFSWMVFSGVGSVYRAYTIIILLLFLLLTKFRITISRENRRLFFYWTLFLVWAGISIMWSMNPESGITVSFGYMLIFLISIVFMVSSDYVDNEKVDDVWLLMGAIWILLYLVTGRTRFSLSSRTTLIILGNETDNNEFAGTFVVPVSLMIYEVLHGKSKTKLIVLTASVLLIIYIVIMTGSRGGLLALLIAITVTIFTTTKITMKRFIIILSSVIISIIVINTYIIPVIPKDILLRFTLDELDSGGYGRTSKWLAAYNMLKDANLFRVLFGYGGFGAMVLNQTSTMHNQFVQVIMDYGVIGFSFYMLLLTASFRNLWRENRKYVGAFIGMMVMCMTITTGPAYKPLWIFLMMSFLHVGSDSRYFINQCSCEEATRI